MLKRYGGEQNRKLHSMLKRYREGLSRETRTALTAVCFFRRTENLCRIAPKTEYERGMPRYPADDTRHIFKFKQIRRRIKPEIAFDAEKIRLPGIKRDKKRHKKPARKTGPV
mgnify:CR=1 FL=1